MDAIRSLQRSGDALPLHRRVEDSLRLLMDDPEYADGQLLPDELTIAQRLGVSRGTVRTAIGRLVAEGRLERKAGVGTRVVQRSTESAISAWRSLSKEMLRHGIEVELFAVQLRTVSATRDAAGALQVEVGTKVQRLDRVRGWDGAPVLRSRSWFHPRVQLSSQDWSRPLYDLVADVSGISAERAREAFTAEPATAELARNLQVDVSSPLLLRRHTVFDAANRPFEFAEVHYVSERFTLTLDLTRA